MQNRTPIPRRKRDIDLSFTPVPRKYRHDGWTPERQRAFIDALADTGSVSQAAKAVNMSPEGAYYLRRQPGAESFCRAWEIALDYGASLVEAGALERAIHGVPVPHYHQGKKVGEHRVFNERLTMWVLEHRKSEKYGSGRIGRGTKSLETQAREADAGLSHRIEELREQTAELLTPKQLAVLAERREAWLAKLADLYEGRVRMERRCRLEGDIIGADFYLRQLTHMEVLLELDGAGTWLLKRANGGYGSGEVPADQAICSTDLTDRLDSIRRAAWAKAGEPDRPAHPGNRTQLSNAMYGDGSDMREREHALKAARKRAARAQAEWEAALKEQVEILQGARQA